jgi:hypothetical protein
MNALGGDDPLRAEQGPGRLPEQARSVIHRVHDVAVVHPAVQYGLHRCRLARRRGGDLMRSDMSFGTRLRYHRERAGKTRAPT